MNGSPLPTARWRSRAPTRKGEERPFKRAAVVAVAVVRNVNAVVDNQVRAEDSIRQYVDWVKGATGVPTLSSIIASVSVAPSCVVNTRPFTPSAQPKPMKCPMVDSYESNQYGSTPEGNVSMVVDQPGDLSAFPSRKQDVLGIADLIRLQIRRRVVAGRCNAARPEFYGSGKASGDTLYGEVCGWSWSYHLPLPPHRGLG